MMEQQVSEAALAMVRPTTDSITRSAASGFLETWNRSPEAWPCYAAWLHSFDNSEAANPSHESVGIQLLCFQLLQSKIRREVPYSSSSSPYHHHALPHQHHLSSIQSELASFLHSPFIPTATTTPACICLTALSVRSGNTSNLVQSCCSQPNRIALCLLGNVPLELEACSDLPTSRVTAELQPHVPAVLHCVRQKLLSGNDAAEAVDALKHWVTTAGITLSMMMMMNGHQQHGDGASSSAEPILPVLVQLLSSNHIADEKILVCTSQALTEAILLPSDNCTESRSAACSLLFQAISQAGCGAVPLQLATESDWDDACHAVATLVCTFVMEEVDTLVSQPAERLLQLLLEIQNHPLAKVRIVALDCWLTVQEIPTSDRHEHWKAPLYSQVVECLMHHLVYPVQFQDWSSPELELDQSEFEEFRRMVKDVLVSAYFLLRSSYVQRMIQWIIVTNNSSNDVWPVQEAALFGLVATAREVCARVKSIGGGSLLAQDRNQTAELLLQLVQNLTSGDGNNNSSSIDSSQTVAAVRSTRHALVLTRVTELIDAYAPTWATKCSADAIFHLLDYVNTVLVVVVAGKGSVGGGSETTIVAAAKALRSLLVNCASVLIPHAAIHGPLRECVRGIMEAASSTNVEEAMVIVAEGCARILMQLKDEAAIRQSLSELVGPLLQRGHTALSSVPPPGTAWSEQTVLVVEALGRYLHVIHIIVRFSDASSSAAATEHESCPISDLLSSVLPFLEQVTQRVSQSEYVLDKVLSLFEQILKTAPELVAPSFQQTIKFVVNVFEATHHASAMGYMTSAVEFFGASHVDAFRELLDHVALLVFQFFHTTKRVDERPDLIAAFYQLNQRYVLYCPAALLRSSQFSSIVACAVECLSACQGERESTRAALNFLSLLFGWRSLRLSSQALGQLQTCRHLVDQQRMLHGARILQSCIATLIGGPQMLWPASTDCVFAVLSASTAPGVISNLENPAAEEVSNDHLALTRQWLEAAMPAAEQQDNNRSNTNNLYSKVVTLLLGLAQQGPKAKTKVKMLLTDYSKIHKGEMTEDALLTYSL